MELLILVNEKDELVYKQAFPSKENLKLYTDLVIKSYGAIDILKILLKTNNYTYFGCIDTHKDYKISALVYPSNYKCLFIHKQTKNTKKFLHELYYFYRHFIIYEIIDYTMEIQGIEENVNSIYLKYYK